MIRGKRTYKVIGHLRTTSNTYEVIGYVVAKNKHHALLKALLREEDVKQKLPQYYWDTIRVEIC